MFTLMCFYFAVREVSSICSPFVLIIAFRFNIKHDSTFIASQNIRTFNPLLQFFSVKFVIFFAFWQSVLLKILAHFALLPTQSPSATHRLSVSLAMFLTCIEMALAGVIHLWAFDYAPFVSVAGEGEANGGVRVGVKDSLWFLDIWHDVRAVGAFCFGRCGRRRVRRGNSGGWRRWSSSRVVGAPEERRALVGDS